MQYSDALAQTAGENMLVGVALILFSIAFISSLAFQWFVHLSAKTDKMDGKLQDGKAIAYIFFRVYSGLVIVCILLAVWAMLLGLQIQV